MDNKVKTAFEQIHADHSLKEKTKAAVYRYTDGFGKAHRTGARRFVTATACMLALMLVIGGYFSYTTPVAAVSIDVNPSVELQINIYDRVINVKGYNDDGVTLANELSVENMNYTDAINSILTNEKIASSIIASDGLLEVTITSRSQKRANRLQSCISDQTSIGSENIYCSDNHDDVERAHSAGISFGKYRAYLELHEINPDITIEDIRNLTMREIRDMIEGQLSDAPGAGVQEGGHGNGNGSDNSNGHGHRKQSE